MCSARKPHTQSWLMVACFVYALALKMEAVRSSETSMNFNWTTWCHIPESNTLNTGSVFGLCPRADVHHVKEIQESWCLHLRRNNYSDLKSKSLYNWRSFSQCILISCPCPWLMTRFLSCQDRVLPYSVPF
jgi:hypothetical protein